MGEPTIKAEASDPEDVQALISIYTAMHNIAAALGRKDIEIKFTKEPRNDGTLQPLTEDNFTQVVSEIANINQSAGQLGIQLKKVGINHPQP